MRSIANGATLGQHAATHWCPCASALRLTHEQLVRSDSTTARVRVRGVGAAGGGAVAQPERRAHDRLADLLSEGVEEASACTPDWRHGRKALK